VEITSFSTNTIAVTVYYLDDRGVDLIEFVSVPSNIRLEREFPKPGRGVKRVILEANMAPGDHAVELFSSSLPGRYFVADDIRLVFDVVDAP
jgi:hypothetical protein